MMKGMKTKKLDRGHLNRRFERYNIEKWIERDPEEKFVVRDCGAKGKGLFVRQDVNKGDFLLFYRESDLIKRATAKQAKKRITLMFLSTKNTTFTLTPRIRTVVWRVSSTTARTRNQTAIQSCI